MDGSPRRLRRPIGVRTRAERSPGKRAHRLVGSLFVSGARSRSALVESWLPPRCRRRRGRTQDTGPHGLRRIRCPPNRRSKLHLGCPAGRLQSTRLSSSGFCRPRYEKADVARSLFSSGLWATRTLCTVGHQCRPLVVLGLLFVDQRPESLGGRGPGRGPHIGPCRHRPRSRKACREPPPRGGQAVRPRPHEPSPRVTATPIHRLHRRRATLPQPSDR